MKTHHHHLGLVAACLCALATSPVFAQDAKPSFDCAKAQTRVEKAICTQLDAWFDQTMADLYKSVRAVPDTDIAELQSGQRAWLARRNQCAGSGDKLANCLLDSYRTRLVELSGRYDSQKLTGRYASTTYSGDLDSVLFPDGILAMNVSTVRPGSNNSCAYSLRAPVIHANQVHKVEPPDASAPDNRCEVDLAFAGPQVNVKTKGCDSYCGYGVRFDGLFNKKR
ncbi:hypothetical protein CLU95_1527 [Variovorax sp. 54]|uniref:lysozyme inhibitor LprI family protein n=1 Tax=Variovorax sp. 54 TaxID=2035212 RepID=UPI000C196313|nr:hypothetical protein [Variovorax sp. 54]PIF74400.1 hypothetical protein CLU95_1527 [Variovorax sp. 54]